MYDCMSAPTIYEVGGGDITIDFDLKNYHNGSAYNAENCTAQLAISDYLYRTTPLLKYEAAIKADLNGVLSVASFVIPASDSVKLSGAYIYQVSIKDASGNFESPMQGKMVICPGINADFVNGG